MVEDPTEDTQQAMFRLMTEMNGKLDAILDRTANLENEMRSMRVRMQSIEQQALAMTEQAASMHKRFDDVVERIERLEKRLTMASV